MIKLFKILFVAICAYAFGRNATAQSWLWNWIDYRRHPEILWSIQGELSPLGRML